MTVRECIILADFAQYVGLPNLSRHERLLKLECLLFHAWWDVEFGVGLVGGEKILASQIGRLRHANERQHALQRIVNLGLEALFRVLDDVELRMADPRLNKSLVNLTSLLD